MSPKFAKMLSALGEDVVHLRDHYAPDTDDIIFLPEISQHGDVFVTGDPSIQTRQAESRALRQAGVVSLFLGPFYQKMQLWPQAVWLVQRWPQLRTLAEGLEPPACMDIKHNGKGIPFRL